MEKQDESLRKKERLCSKKLIDTLFCSSGSHAMTAFPLKAVYRLVEQKEQEYTGNSRVLFMVSVPKKHFKRAVKRNRVKRQVREAYRKKQYLLKEKMGSIDGRQLLIAFIWLSDELISSDVVEQRVYNLLQRIVERI